jgi:uncharacterized protein YdeI (YjbR/CyaY-like superfamily)
LIPRSPWTFEGPLLTARRGLKSKFPLTPPRLPPSPLFFETAAAFRRWLEKNGERATELFVVFRKVGTGEPSLTWPESVDEALCFGWIDGVRKRIDERSYQIRFTPRKPDSIWSAINVAKVHALTAQGRMQPAGLAAFARRTQRKSSVYSYEQAGALQLTAEEIREFKKKSAPAWRYFEASPPSYRRTILHWVTSARQPATRARRLAQLVAACLSRERLVK